LLLLFVPQIVSRYFQQNGLPYLRSGKRKSKVSKVRTPETGAWSITPTDRTHEGKRTEDGEKVTLNEREDKTEVSTTRRSEANDGKIEEMPEDRH
jgi:hypothetical protein